MYNTDLLNYLYGETALYMNIKTLINYLLLILIKGMKG